MATIPNFFKLEIARARLALYDRMMDQVFDIRDGHLHLSNRPGLGFRMDKEFLQKH